MSREWLKTGWSSRSRCTARIRPKRPSLFYPEFKIPESASSREFWDGKCPPGLATFCVHLLRDGQLLAEMPRAATITIAFSGNSHRSSHRRSGLCSAALSFSPSRAPYTPGPPTGIAKATTCGDLVEKISGLCQEP